MAKKTPAKKRKKSGAPPLGRKAEARVGVKLTEAEEDLQWHVEHGYQLETDSLGGAPVLRSLKHDEVVRPASANRNTVKALQDRGLIIESKGGEPLRIVWRLKEKTRKYATRSSGLWDGKRKMLPITREDAWQTKARGARRSE